MSSVLAGNLSALAGTGVLVGVHKTLEEHLRRKLYMCKKEQSVKLEIFATSALSVAIFYFLLRFAISRPSLVEIGPQIR